jgi:hypothetical protein
VLGVALIAGHVLHLSISRWQHTLQAIRHDVFAQIARQMSHLEPP